MKFAGVFFMALVAFLAVQTKSEASPQHGYLRLSGLPSCQGAGGGARTRDRRVSADFRAGSLFTVPPTLLTWSFQIEDSQISRTFHKERSESRVELVYEASSRQECLKDYEVLPDWTTVDCFKLYGKAVDKVTLDMYCCSQAGHTAKIDSGYDKGKAYFNCKCED
ncbi:hypothetical protein PoB_004946300 [Plakobranchus ocellatus]|uniref:Uncharacterized protein n=1 Tax=Plakobranchus ocellatus TaxID=259542 RepID=A0AAV4BTM1_9GAST|nr:hypothetical protein PoB_004946300 [Plakobranchus ocellatus]